VILRVYFLSAPEHERIHSPRDILRHSGYFGIEHLGYGERQSDGLGVSAWIGSGWILQRPCRSGEVLVLAVLGNYEVRGIGTCLLSHVVEWL
jgi:hypothetical protein